MKLLISLICLFLVSCSKNEISSGSINSVISQCDSLGGVKSIHLSGSDYLAICNTDKFIFSKAEKATLYDDFVLGSELRSCEAFCTKHEGLKQVQTNRECSSPEINFFKSCDSFTDQISCTCENGTIKKDSHEIKAQMVGKIPD